jgi:linoleoyl-CoA desaturase
MNIEDDLQFGRKELMTKYVELKQQVTALGLDGPEPFPILTQMFIHVILTVGGFFGAFYSENPFLIGFCLLVSAYGAVGLSTSGHTCSHYATTGNRVIDELLTSFCFTFMLGFSSIFWRNKHVANHHANPNNVMHDEDIRLSPIFAVTDQEVASGNRLQRWFYRWQIVPVMITISFALINPQVTGWFYLSRKMLNRNERNITAWFDTWCIVSHFIIFLIVPMAFLPPAQVFLYFIIRNLLTGYFGFAIFAPAHFPREALLLDENAKQLNHVLKQVYTSVNFKTGWVGGLLCQGVEYQIEHHLLPKISHHNYPKVSVLVRKFCEENNLPYATVGWGEGIFKSLDVFITPKKTISSQDLINNHFNVNSAEISKRSSVVSSENSHEASLV